MSARAVAVGGAALWLLAGCAGSSPSASTDATLSSMPAAPAPTAADRAPAPTDATPAPPSPAAAPAPEITTEQALATFDEVWTRIDETDFDPDHGGVDWVAVRAELRPRAESATTQRALREVLHEMVSRLGRSHFAVIPGEVADRSPPSDPAPAGVDDRGPSTSAPAPAPGPSSDAKSVAAVPGGAASDAGADAPPPPDPEDAEDEWATFGLGLRLVEERVTVLAVEPGSPAAEAGVAPGWIVRSIDGADPLHRLESIRELEGSMVRYAVESYVSDLDRGSTGRAHTLVFVQPGGAERTVELRRVPSRSEIVKIGSLPPLPQRVEHRWIPEDVLARAGASGRRVGYIAFSVWMPGVAEPLERAVDELRTADGIVIDLRGNPGGFGGMVMGVGGHFVDEPVSLGSMETRETTIEFRLNPRRATRDGRSVKPIAAPLAILVDPLTASTSEVFAGGLQDIDRARIFGETSAGAVLPAQMHRLPNGDVLLHAVANYRVPSGASLEGTGVVPDAPRTLTREALTAEGDPVLMDALRWIREAAPPVP